MRKCSVVGVLPVFLLCVSIGAAGCCVEIGCSIPLAKYTRVVDVSAPLEAGGCFAAKAHNGSLTVTGADVADCRVTATIVARASSEGEARTLAERTKIRLEPSGNKLTAKIDKPRMIMNQSVSVSLEVTVPRQTGAALTTHNGKVKISNLNGRIDAKTHNGRIRASGVGGATRLETHNGSVTCGEVLGDIRLKSHNGNVRAAYSESAPPVCDVSIVTHNGRVELSAPPGYSATADVSTHNGSIRTELPITVLGKVSGRKLRGTIGAGEGILHVKTHNGSITIKQRQSVLRVEMLK